MQDAGVVSEITRDNVLRAEDGDGVSLLSAAGKFDDEVSALHDDDVLVDDEPPCTPDKGPELLKEMHETVDDLRMKSLLSQTVNRSQACFEEHTFHLVSTTLSTRWS